MATKIAVVTGSNKGIGFGIVKNLCTQFDGIVYLTARDIERGKKAVEELKKEGLNPSFHQLDINDPQSIHTFAKFLSKNHQGVDVLVNNAAIAFKNDAIESFKVQAEFTLRTNYFALKDVCKEFFPLLRPHARVVILSSSAGFLQRIPGEELRGQFASPDLNEESLDKLMLEFIKCVPALDTWTFGLEAAFHQLDINDKKSIKSFAEFISEKHGGIDVLVNNAAIAFKHDATDPFGHQAEVTLKTNYFALKDVCEGLFPLLRPHARVVVVSSSLGHLLAIPGEQIRKQLCDPNLTEDTIDQLMLEFIKAAKDGTYADKGWPSSTYVVSKVGASALTRLYHKKFLADSREDIVINHVHPGYVDTDMTSHKGPLTIAQGADAPTYAALLPPNCTSPKGDYIWYTREIIDWVNGPVPV